MACARRHLAAPTGLKMVSFGFVYYKHVAPRELAAAAPTLVLRRGGPSESSMKQNGPAAVASGTLVGTRSHSLNHDAEESGQ